MAQLVLVADGGEARVLRREGTDRSPILTEIDRIERASRHLAARDLTSDISGRVFSYAGRGRAGKGRPVSTPHGANSDFDPHRAEVERFARRVVRRLRELQRGGECHHLLVICEPKFLGLLRREFPKALRAVVSSELPRDMIHAPVKQLEKAVRAQLAA